jgi:transcription elongation factor Elf1
MKHLVVKQDHLRLFPCCVCSEPREVRITKKGKPYIICNPCGVQMFVRVDTGIRLFDALVADADRNNVWKRLAELQHRYQFDCPRCGKKFWLTTELIKTSWASGKLEGYRCPDAECGGIAKPEKAA